MPNLITDPKYIINLPHRADRKQQLTDDLDRLGITNYRFVDAVNGHDIHYTGTLKKGAQGCKLSHLSIIQQAKAAQLPHITIMEDDCHLHPDIVTLLPRYMLQLPPEWDMLYYGANNRLPLQMVSDNIGRCTRSYSTVCYVVRHTVYDKIMEQAALHDKEIDLIYTDHVHPHCNAYCLSPNLAGQQAGYSDIEGFGGDYSQYYGF